MKPQALPLLAVYPDDLSVAFDGTNLHFGNFTGTWPSWTVDNSTGANVIKGISFFITGPEPAGFEIDDLTFGAVAVIVMPEPSAVVLLGLGLAGLAAARLRIRRRE